MSRLFSGRLASTALFAVIAQTALAQYTWTGANSTDFQDAGNWSPSRSSVLAADTLTFNNAATTSVVTNIPTQTIGGLSVLSGAAIRFDNTALAANSVRTLTVSGGGQRFSVASGGSLTLGGGNGCQLIVQLDAGTTGSVSGDVILNATAAAVPHRFRVLTVDGLVFTSGSSCAMAPVSTGAQGGFNADSTLNGANNSITSSVRFLDGSTYYQGGLKSGARTGGTGSNPFTYTQPNAIVIFDPNSNYVNLGGVPSSSGRTYGNFIWRDGYGAARDLGGGGSNTMTVAGDFRVEPPGGTMAAGLPAPGTITSTLTGTNGIGGVVYNFQGNFTITTGSAPFIDLPGTLPASDRLVVFRKNITIENPALFTPFGSANRFYVTSSTLAQTVDVRGTTFTRLTNQNQATLNLASDLRVSARLSFEGGNIVTGANTLIGPDTPGVSRTSGYVDGRFARTIYAASSGGRNFEVGSNGKFARYRLVLNSGTATTGTITVFTTAGDAADVPNASQALDRTWTVDVQNLGAYNASVELNYDDSELGAANESRLKPSRRTAPNTWTSYASIANFTLDTTANIGAALGLSDVSGVWTLFEADNLAAARDWAMFE